MSSILRPGYFFQFAQPCFVVQDLFLYFADVTGEIAAQKLQFLEDRFHAFTHGAVLDRNLPQRPYCGKANHG